MRLIRSITAILMAALMLTLLAACGGGGDLMPGTGGATGVLTVRDGSFDVTY